MNHLLILTCHAVYLDDQKYAPEDDRNWVLYDYQMGEPSVYKQQMKRFLEILKDDKKLVGIISGGDTRGNGSESESYSRLMKKTMQNLYQPEKIFLEKSARDSFENLLFSLCLYEKYFQCMPAVVSLISFGFKKKRFLYHYHSLNLPEIHQFRFISEGEPSDKIQAEIGEEETYRNFLKDPFGIRPPLSQKKQKRHAYDKDFPYMNTSNRFKSFLDNYYKAMKQTEFTDQTDIKRGYDFDSYFY